MSGQDPDADLDVDELARRLPLADHPREAVRVWIEPVARQLDDVVAIGDLYRFDRFAAPDTLWEDLQQRYPEPLGSG